MRDLGGKQEREAVEEKQVEQSANVFASKEVNKSVGRDEGWEVKGVVVVVVKASSSVLLAPADEVKFRDEQTNQDTRILRLFHFPLSSRKFMR